MPKIIDGLFKVKKINDFIIAKETIDIDNNNLKILSFFKGDDGNSFKVKF